MKRIFLKAVFLLVLSMVGCSKSNSSSTNTVPTPTNPAPAPAPSPVPAPTEPEVDNRFPEWWASSIAVDLTDKATYQGLIDLSGNVFLPLVGDARVSLQVTQNRGPEITGFLGFGFEDKQGFWAMEYAKNFPGTGRISSNTLDLIFTDDEIVMRAKGTKNGDNLVMDLFYRNRLPNETACVQFEICTYNYYSRAYECTNAEPDANAIALCQSYMNTTHPSVKKLGTFRTQYSIIAVLPEDN